MNILCKNTRIENFQTVECRRFLQSIPECVIEALRSNPGETIRLRCPTCPSYQRFINVYSDKHNQLIFEATGEKPDYNEPEVVFDKLLNSKQVG